MSIPAKAVFLSYASEDAEAAERLCTALRAVGVEVWFDQNELRGGDAWDASIRRQIKNCALFIPLISRTTHARGEGYFRLEWKLAVDRSHLMASDLPFLLPVVIDDTPSQDERVPDRFREVQWTRLPMGANANVFADRVRRLLSPEIAEPANENAQPVKPVAGPPLHASARKARGSPVLWIVGVLLACGIGYLAVEKLTPAKQAGSANEPASPPARAETASDKSIAVLPFADMSEKKDQQYFADGMAEEIIDVLSKVPQLIVISRTSSFQFKGRDVDAKLIGSTLGTRYIVEGSVRKSANRVRITAQLIDVRDGSSRWSETYDRNVEDAFEVQDEISASLVRALELAVGAGEMPPRVPPKSAAAYDLYLRGRQAFDRYDRDGFEQAADLFRQSLQLDPQFAAAAAASANVRLFMSQWGYLSPKEGYEGARHDAQLAMNLDKHLAVPHQILATVALQYDWDWPLAEREAKLGVELDPLSATSRSFQGLVALTLGQLGDAKADLNAALRLDPLNPNILFVRGWVQFWSGQLPEAEATLRKSIQISKTYESAHFYIGHVLLVRGALTEALAEMNLELDGSSRLAGISSVQFAMGHRKEADAALAELLKTSSGDWASGIAGVYAQRNDPDKAFEWLDRAYAQKDEDVYLIKGNPLFRGIQNDPRYAAFLRRMKLPL